MAGLSQKHVNPAQEDSFDGCPIPATHRRQRHAHTLWHQALEHYHHAEQFRANLNATIEALRNITFILQTEKTAIRDFDEWYGPWQQRLKTDLTSKWLNDARVTVVHQGDLDSYSFAQIRLVSWQEEVLCTVNVPIQTPSSLILQNPALLDLLDPSRNDSRKQEDAAVLIERRWSTKELQGREILSTLAHVYGLLADIVLDAHSHLGKMNCIPSGTSHPDFPSAYDRTGMLRCMIASVEARTERFKQSSQSPIVPTADGIPMMVGSQEAISRYELDNAFLSGQLKSLDPLHLAEKLVHVAKHVMRRDKHHVRMMFIRDGEGKWHHLSLLAGDRTEKYVLMQLVARFVEGQGCDAVIEIGEMWTAKISVDAPPVTQEVENIPGRNEALGVLVATRDGLLRWYLTPVKRGPFGGIKLGDTTQIEDHHLPYFLPVIEVWRRQCTFRAPDGSQSRVWEADALDLCPCGGPNRYGECCRPLILKRREMRAAGDDGDATEPEGFTAEAKARASLGQYVIWIRQHTVASMHSGAEFHAKIVQVDALALESHTLEMIRELSAVGKTDLILPQLRRLTGLVGVPRLAMRVTALTSRWLFECGRPEEAVLELDVLGVASEIQDSLALSLIAQHLDLTETERKRILHRAIEVAACDEEKHLAQLNLASYFFTGEEFNEALSLVRSVIRDTKGDQSSMVRSSALIFFWRITQAEEDFRTAILEMEKQDLDIDRYRNGSYLIDSSKYAKAEQVLAKLVDAGDVQAKLLLIDARLRCGAREAAESLFNTIDADVVSPGLRFPYAVAMSLLVLVGGYVELRDVAISALDRLAPTGGEQDAQVKSLLQSLTNMQMEKTHDRLK